MPSLLVTLFSEAGNIFPYQISVAKFCSTQSKVVRVMTSYQFFKMAATESKIYFHIQIWWLHSFKQVKIYLRTKFLCDISIHGWSKMTYGFGKRTAAMLVILLSVSFYRFWSICIDMPFCICLPNFVVIRQKTPEVWRHIDFQDSGIESEFYFRVQVWWLHSFIRRWKSVTIPNFDEISPSTAEIKLLPVSENGRPPY